MAKVPRWRRNNVLQETKNTIDCAVHNFDSSGSFPHQLD